MSTFALCFHILLAQLMRILCSSVSQTSDIAKTCWRLVSSQPIISELKFIMSQTQHMSKQKSDIISKIVMSHLNFNEN
jgi:hypothetical protein